MDNLNRYDRKTLNAAWILGMYPMNAYPTWFLLRKCDERELSYQTFFEETMGIDLEKEIRQMRKELNDD